jgi:uncharacterized phage protein gp47/JayE
MNYGITAKGFEPKTYQVLLNELYDRWKTNLGDIDTNPDGALGQLAISTTFANAELWEVFQSIYFNSDIRTASGSHLDKMVAIQGFTRQVAVKASAPCYFGGQSGTTITQNTQVVQSTSGEMFKVLSEINISNTNTVGVDLNIKDGVSPKININGLVIEGSDLQSFREDLLLKAVTLGIRLDDSFDSDIAIRSFDPFKRFAITVVDNSVDVDQYYQLGFVVANSDSIIVIPMKSIDTKGATISGWDSVYNPVNGASGREDESDERLRTRLKRLRTISQSGTQLAIEAKVWENVRDVSEVKVFSNRRDVADQFGRKRHSVQVVVEGGDDNAVAEAIWRTVPAGILTHGSVEVDVDGSGNNIRFDRVNTLFGWVKIEILDKNPEEDYPTNGETLIRNAVYAKLVRTVQLGVDLISQKLVGVVYNSVSGLANIRITVAVTGTRDVDPNDDPVGTPYDYNIETYNSGFKNRVVVAPTDKVEWRDAFSPDRIIVVDKDV